MKMADHMRRFSMPPPGFTVANQAVWPAAKQSSPASPLANLAQIYALAQQRAAETVKRRQWDALVQRLFER